MPLDRTPKSMWRPEITMKRFAGSLLGSPLGLRCAAALGHSWPDAQIIRSLCWHAGAGAWHPEQQLTARMQRGFDLVIDITDHTFRQLYFHGEYEPEVTRLIEHLAEPGQIWLDIGANVGYFSILLSKLVGDSGEVLAFEPNPLTRRFFELSVKRNGNRNIKIYSCALGASRSVAKLHIPKNPGTILGGHGRPSLIRQRDTGETVGVEVEVLTLDSILGETKIWGLKIDVEGYETEVLKGAQNLLVRNPPTVIFSEVTHFPDALMKPDELVRSIVALGYTALHAETMQEWNPGNLLMAVGPRISCSSINQGRNC
jgi:FkbM family methyltransferase